MSGVELTSASEVWDFLASEGAIADWIRSSTLTDSQRIGLGYAVVADRKDRRAVPMEAVAWRETRDKVAQIVRLAMQDEYLAHRSWDDDRLGSRNRVAHKATAAILQALAVIPQAEDQETVK